MVEILFIKSTTIMVRKINSFHEHTEVIKELFTGESLNETQYHLKEGDIYFHTLSNEGIYSVIFNVLNYQGASKVALEITDDYNADYIIIFFLKNLSFTPTNEDEEYAISNAQGFVVMNARHNINIDFLKAKQAHHITFLVSKKALVGKKWEKTIAILDQISFRFFDEHHDLSMTRNTIRQTFSYLSELKYEVQKKLSSALLFMAFEYIDRQSEPLLTNSDPAIEREMLNKMIQVQNKVIERIDDKPNLDELSRTFLLSTTELEQHFQIVFGQTISSYHQKHRIYKGRDLLVSKEMNAKEIAYELGYSDLPHFSRTFKKEFGLSPRAYLQQFI